VQKLHKIRGQLEWVDTLGQGPYERPMSSRPRNRKPITQASPSRFWRASLIRSEAQVLGEVEAPSREAAEAAAIWMFNPKPRPAQQARGAGTG